MRLTQEYASEQAHGYARERADGICHKRGLRRRTLEHDRGKGSGRGAEKNRDQSNRGSAELQLPGKDHRDAGEPDHSREDLSLLGSLEPEGPGKHPGGKRHGRVEHRRDSARDALFAPVEQRKIDAEIQKTEDRRSAQGASLWKGGAPNTGDHEEKQGGEEQTQGRAPKRRHRVVAEADREKCASPDERHSREGCILPRPARLGGHRVVRSLSTRTAAVSVLNVNAARKTPLTATCAPSRGAPPSLVTTISLPVPSSTW